MDAMGWDREDVGCCGCCCIIVQAVVPIIVAVVQGTFQHMNLVRIRVIKRLNQVSLTEMNGSKRE